MSFSTQVFRILKKELLQERNSKFFINSVMMFSFLILIIILFPFASFEIQDQTKNVLLWVIIYFSTMTGFQNNFTKESDRNTIFFMKTQFRGDAVFWGKSLFNIIMMTIVLSIIIILYSILFNFEVLIHPIIFIFVVIEIVALSINGTLMSALLSFSGNNATLYAIIGFPLLFPIFLIGLNATEEFVITGSISMMMWGSVVIYDLLSIFISILVFDFIWENMN